jgi:hypothetical protein
VSRARERVPANRDLLGSALILPSGLCLGFTFMDQFALRSIAGAWVWAGVFVVFATACVLLKSRWRR